MVRLIVEELSIIILGFFLVKLIVEELSIIIFWVFFGEIDCGRTPHHHFGVLL
ncbi:MAG: hypothetical protein LPK00_01780 [Bacillaceae bacterium]|nr:hypothetical protein [Bacillaceae bacterium]